MYLNLNKVDVAFGNSKKVVTDFAETSLDNFGIAKGTSLDLASGFGDMATSMDITQEAAAKMGTQLVGRAGDLSSFKNISIDVAKTALNGIFTGETESLKVLGVVMTQANLNTYALANGFGKTVEEMTEAEKVNLRYAYVMDKTSNAAGDFKETSDGTANSARVFTESLKELGAEFGEELLPVITPMIKEATNLVKGFGALDQQTKRNVIGIAGVVAATGPLLSIFGRLTMGTGAVVKGLGKLAGHFGKAQASGKLLENGLKTQSLQVSKTTTAFGGLKNGLKGAIGSFTGLAGSAGGATTAVAGVGLGAIGLAVAIPGAIMALGAWVQHNENVKNGSQEIIDKNGALIKSAQDLGIQIETSVANRKNEIESIGLDVEGQKKLADALYKVDLNAGNVVEKKKLMQTMIDELNGSIPNLNLTLDEETGALSRTKDEVYNVIEAFKKEAQIQAAFEMYVENIKEMTEAEKAYNDLVNKGKEIDNQKVAIVQELIDKYGDFGRTKDGMAMFDNECASKTLSLTKAQIENGKAVEDAAKKVNLLNDENGKLIEQATGEMPEAVAKIPEKVGPVGGEAARKLRDSYMSESQYLKKAVEDSVSDAAKGAENKKIDYQHLGGNLGGGLNFGLLNWKGRLDLTGKEVAGSGKDGAESKKQDFLNAGGNWGSNLNLGFWNWKEPIKTTGADVAKSGNDAAALKTPDYASTGSAFGNVVNTAFGNWKESIKTTGKDLAGRGRDGAESQKEVFFNAGDKWGTRLVGGLHNQKESMYEEALGIAGDSKNGYNDGLIDFGEVGKNIEDFGTKILNRMKEVLGVHSPSTEFYDIAQNTGFGFINGLKDIDIIGFMKGIAQSAIESFSNGTLGIGNLMNALGSGYNGIKQFVNFAKEQLGSNALDGLLNLFNGGGFAGSTGSGILGNKTWGSPTGKSPFEEDFAWDEDFGERNGSVGSQWHQGLDFNDTVGDGSPLFAIQNGVVSSAGYNGGYGNQIIIDFGDGIAASYSHLSSIGVEQGQQVSMGQFIGNVGNTGASYGSHLHFGLLVNGEYVDPKQLWGFDVGTRSLPSDMVIQAHEGEMILPKKENPFVNSGGSIINDLFEKMFANVNGQGKDGATQIKIENNFNTAQDNLEINRQFYNSLRKACLIPG
ncbi:MAG: phage tail tape measure protein [Eubacterium sp.]